MNKIIELNKEEIELVISALVMLLGKRIFSKEFADSFASELLNKLYKAEKELKSDKNQ